MDYDYLSGSNLMSTFSWLDYKTVHVATLLPVKCERRQLLSEYRYKLVKLNLGRFEEGGGFSVPLVTY